MHNVIPIHNSNSVASCAAANTTQMQRSQLSLVDISYKINNKYLLKNVDLDLTPHGVTAIMGFNGAGKSMLLKIMHGIVEPTKGSVLWSQNTADDIHRLSQAMVFQKPVLLRRSAKANIDFVLKQRSGHNPAARNTLLAKVGLEQKAAQPARLLSGGEQQRLALARALACQPQVLFLDEATASLDPASTAIIEQIVSEQAASGTKVIMVTHDAGQALRLSEQIVFMDAGRIVEQRATTEFFQAPSSQAAAAYLEGRLYHHV